MKAKSQFIAICIVYLCSYSYAESHRVEGSNRVYSGSSRNEEAKKKCTKFQIQEALETLKSINVSRPEGLLASFMADSPSGSCPGIPSYCFGKCAKVHGAAAQYCTEPCKLRLQKADCKDEMEITAASEALAACSRFQNSGQCVSSFMIRENQVAHCPRIPSVCFAECVKNHTVNPAECRSCFLYGSPLTADCEDEAQLKAAVRAIDACAGSRSTVQCLSEFMIRDNKVAHCPGIPERCTRVCNQYHPGSLECGSTCNIQKWVAGNQPVAPVRPRPPRTRPTPPPRPTVLSPVEQCRKHKDPIACDNDKLCYLVGAGVVRRGLGPPAYTCCAKGYSKECEEDIRRGGG